MSRFFMVIFAKDKNCPFYVILFNGFVKGHECNAQFIVNAVFHMLARCCSTVDAIKGLLFYQAIYLFGIMFYVHYSLI